MSSNSGANARVSIPSSVRKTIQNIKEIGVNHSDEEVYAMLKECSMDPNETVQRLLFLDTFHEVKRKRDKRKENLNGRVFEDLRRKVTNQARGTRNGRGSFSSQYTSHDAGGGKNAAVRKENGYEDRGNAFKSPALPVLKELDSSKPRLMGKTSSTTVKGSIKSPDGAVIVGHIVQKSEGVDTVLQKDNTIAGPMNTEITLSQSEVNTEHSPSASDPLLTQKQSCNSQLPTAVVAMKSEVKSLQIAVEMKDSGPAEKELGSSRELIGQNLIKNQHVPSENSELVLLVEPEINGEISDSEKLSTALDNKSSAANSLVNGLTSIKAIEESTSKLEKLKFSEGQHVILPNHIQVPDAVKNVLNFGSFGSCFAVGVNNILSSDSNGKSNQTLDLVEDGNSNQASEESVEDEIAKKPDSCDEDTQSSADEENYSDPPPSDKIQPLKDDQLKQETLPEVIPQHAVIQTPTYNFGFMPPMLGYPPIPLEALDHQHQVCLPNSMYGNSLATSTPPPVQSPGSIPSSVVVSVQPVPLLRQPYPPNFIPFTHYPSPYFMPPMLQYVSHGAFPPPLPTTNMYMTQTAAPGMKTSPHKPGTNLPNQPPFPIPSGAYTLVNSPQVVTSGVSHANDDLVASMLGQQNPVNLPVNSFFNVLPQGQHFAPMYHPLQNVAAPVLQQAQSMAGPVDSAGLPQPPQPPNVFQQPPQRHQMNWNNNF